MADRHRLIYRAPWRIELTVRRGVQGMLPGSELAKTIARALEAAGAPGPATIGLILTGDAEIAALNQRHMGHRGPTDVLSFPLLGPEAYPDHPGKTAVARPGNPAPAVATSVRTHLGEVVVSVERAAEQAEHGRGGQTGDVRWTPGEELRLLVTHGVLHLCGWDHAAADEEGGMRALERQLLDSVQTR